MNFNCSCGARYQAKPEWAGKKVRCKKCGSQLLVPSQASGSTNRQRTPEELKREKEDLILAKFANSGKKSSEDFIADNIRDSFEEERHSVAVRNVLLGPLCMALSVGVFFLLNHLENGGIAPRVVWVFVMLRGKFWVPPLMVIFGIWCLVSGIMELVAISNARKSRNGK